MTQRTALEKMGFRPGQQARVLNIPEELRGVFEPALDSGLEGTDAAVRTGTSDWHLVFARDADAIREAAALFVPGYRRGHSLWIAYPKKASGIRTDIDRDRGWEPITALGLLGVAQISIDETWSALRFRYRDEIKTIRRRM